MFSIIASECDFAIPKLSCVTLPIRGTFTLEFLIMKVRSCMCHSLDLKFSYRIQI